MEQVSSNSQEPITAPGQKRPTHRRLQRYLILITCVTALAPLAIMTFINYLNDTEAYEAESNFAIAQILSNTKRALEAVIEERQSVLSLIISEQRYEVLANDDQIALTLRNLKTTFGGFVDLSLIDADGNQNYYSGPYELQGINYKDQEWFHEVSLRGVFVSDVFMGHRNFPHFVIAVKREKGPSDFYVLRATIDMEMINRQFYSLNLTRETDAFIINQKGVLQTPSSFYGDVLDTIEIEVPPHARNREVIDQLNQDGMWVTIGYARITGSPFYLVSLTRQQLPLAHWVSRRSQILWFLFVSIAAILIVVYYSSNHMVNLLRKADLKRAKILHNAEYTNKMAALGRLAAGVAHEINNPLAIINEKAGLMKDLATYTPDFPIKDKTLDLVESITGSVERCSRVTHRLLGFGRRMNIQKELIDLPKLLEDVVGFQATEATHRGINVRHVVPDNVPTIESDRGQLQQVFLNLINNAMAAVDNGGEVVIAVDQPNVNEVTVTVSDNGSGISREDIPHVFEPFFSTKGESGTGLGLSITKDLVEKLGGLISVASEPGKGTQFTVNLPVEKAD